MSIMLALTLSIAPQVLDWEEKINHIEEIENSSMLALIHMESTGDPCARRDGSKFVGLLQIGPRYYEDATGEQNHEDLLCDGEKSIDTFLRYLDRYSHVHRWDDRYISIIHKGGPGSVRDVRDKVSDGYSIEEATEYARIDGVDDYYERFLGYKELYEREGTTGQDQG